MSPDNSSISNLGQIIHADYVTASDISPKRMRNIILLLAFSVALTMTGFGIILPVFARRLDELGSGVEALGLMTMSFALAQLIASPIMGSMADKFGRKPLIVLALGSFVAANIGFLFAPSTTVFIMVRAFEGAFASGLMPASMGVVADIVPEEKRAQWVGVVMGSMGVGFIIGPVLGGVLFDAWGFQSPFIASASIAAVALLSAIIVVPETRTRERRWREVLRRRRADAMALAQRISVWDSIPKPMYVFAGLLVMDFIMVFAFTYVEPQMVFYFYDDLQWTTVRFGVVVGVYGLAMVAGQGTLSKLSDKIGRKPVIFVGSILFASFFILMSVVTYFPLMILVGAIAGFGNALMIPAISAFYLDITSEQHRSRVMGIKTSAAALGGVVGPLAVAGAAKVWDAQTIFISAGVLVGVIAIAAMLVLKEPSKLPKVTGSVNVEIAEQRAMAAQASLRGLIIRARNERATTNQR